MLNRDGPDPLGQAGAGSQGDLRLAKSRKHRVVIESVTQEKKKLRQVVS